jgi:hypothetical protein
MKTREFENQDHVVTVEHGNTIDDVLRPEFWSHVAPKLRPYDEIRVRADDGTFYARVLVLSCGRNWAKVHQLEHHRLTSKDVDMSQAAQFEGYDVKWRGPHCKWSVVRKADNVVVIEKLDSQAEATTWLADHLKATS